MTKIVLTSDSNFSVDHRTMIQAALDAVESQGGGMVHLTTGAYYVGPPGGGGKLELAPHG